jgi:hypothetical protein
MLDFAESDIEKLPKNSGEGKGVERQAVQWT